MLSLTSCPRESKAIRAMPKTTWAFGCVVILRFHRVECSDSVVIQSPISLSFVLLWLKGNASTATSRWSKVGVVCFYAAHAA